MWNASDFKEAIVERNVSEIHSMFKNRKLILLDHINVFCYKQLCCKDPAVQNSTL